MNKEKIKAEEGRKEGSQALKEGSKERRRRGKSRKDRRFNLVMKSQSTY